MGHFRDWALYLKDFRQLQMHVLFCTLHKLVFYVKQIVFELFRSGFYNWVMKD